MNHFFFCLQTLQCLKLFLISFLLWMITKAQTTFGYDLMLRTAGLREGRAAGGGIPTLCLCMKSCGGTASVVAGGTKVWMRRNGHRGEMESSFRGESHAHTCAGCLHLAGTLHADAFQRSRWAHQIRIHVFTLDLNVCVCVCLCHRILFSLIQYVKAEGSVAERT